MISLSAVLRDGRQVFLFKPSDCVSPEGYLIESRGQKLSERGERMKHKLKVSVSKEPQTGNIITCREVTIRERIFRFLFGDKRKVTVLIPGDSVGEIAISYLLHNVITKLQSIMENIASPKWRNLQRIQLNYLSMKNPLQT